MEIHIGDRIADITLVGKEGNKVQLTIDGKPYEVDIVMAENGSCSILHNGNSFNAGLVRGEGGKSYDISMLQRSFHVDIVDTQAKYLHMKKGEEEKKGEKIMEKMKYYRMERQLSVLILRATTTDRIAMNVRKRFMPICVSVILKLSL